ncbi:uncharacterized protein LOC131189173 isoform X2 [Ahaetulla prasina]|uniref:uncharacterized protein LOC131189173 isoform X2 n=1 Tax=Ahaetulla prasina TaxID=499056 RepID=UPI002649132F|nr:uncharacterized protein LOC131189173 isoform X2 [Ahaetulla prasina]XP_058021081.1 uncharacterized protein LOC131189173 isoform X2 [Ahaetulla prasina]XP_058021082.1 uncharacterized protein LOC131189173 isoform X2 [Ahaetulla prasina]
MTYGEKMAKTEAVECFSLYDISAIVYTKSAHRIILPMIAELYNLIIAIEQREITHEAFANLETTAEELAKATEELGCIAKRLAEKSGDEVLEKEMVSATQTLLVSGKNILLAVQKLLIQPDVCSSVEELAVSAKRILVGTIKVLWAQEDSTIRRIIQAAHWLFDCLLMLDSAKDVSAVLSASHPFSETLLLVTNLTERFLWDLKESLQQKHLAQTLQTLKNSIPMLFTAKVSHLQYPHEQQMNRSKNYIFDLAKSNVKKLISLLKSNIGRTKKLHERYGFFPQHLHQFLGLMSSPQPIHLREDKLNLPVEVLIFYCMLFADSSRATLKQELIQLCRHLLKFRKAIVDVSTFNGFSKENIKEECFVVKTELEHLNQIIRSAVIYQIFDNLVDIKDPMRKLIEAAMEPCSHVGKEGLLRKLKPLITTFFSHSTQMLKAADLILVTCTERETVEDIEQCINQFNRLLATVPGLLSELSLFPGNGDVSKKLNFLSQIWSSTTESLMMCLDKILDLHEFLDASVQEMVRHKEASEKALDMQDFEHFLGHTSRLCRQATQIVEFISRFVAKARDPIFRNGLLVLIKQLKNAITQTDDSINLCMVKMTSLQAKEEYSKRTKELIEFACNVQKGLDECNQPDILSPLRDGVHDFNISIDVPKALASQDPMEFSTHSFIKQNSSNNAELLVGSLDKFKPPYCPSLEFPRRNIIYRKDAVRTIDLHPLIRELTTATSIHDAIRLNGICADLLELANCCIDAAKEALRIVESPMSDKLLHYKEIVGLIPHFIGLAREVEANPVLNSEQLLQTAILLSEKIDETKHSLTFVVSSWYRLARQLIGFMPPCSSHDEIQSFDEIMEILETLVQLISKVVHSDDRKLLPECSSLQEIFLRVQTKFTCVQTRTKYLLEKAQDISRSHPDFTKQDRFDASCILWSVTIQALLNIVDQFIGRDVLALKELQTKMKYRLCLQSTLTIVSENSVRIQEAAKLSILLCARQGIENEIPSQIEQIKILTESLLQVANALAVSPIAAPSLLVQFEVLQRKLALTAKAILLQLNGLNGEYLSSIQSVVRLSQFISHGTGSNSDLIQKETFGRKAAFLKANIQMVDKVIRDALEEPSKFPKLKENLLATTGNLLLLTDEIMGLAGQFHSQLDQHHHLVDSLLYEWSAKAGYLVRQLQSMKGISETVLQVVRRCLQNDEEHIYSIQPSSLKKEDYTQHQNTLSSGHKAIKAGEGFFSASNKITMYSEDLPSDFQPSHSECSLSPTSSLGDLENHGCLISQIIEEMRVQVSYMAQFLKRKGPIMTKEEVIATAIQVIAGGDALVKFAGRITKDCLNERCAAELLCALEKTKTINYQLSIVTRVIASTGSSRSSVEHLVSNAQNLFQGILQMFMAAEAACVKGLQHPSTDTEESNTATFCSQSRKSLGWYGAKESLNSDKEELGLCKTGLWPSPLSPL